MARVRGVLATRVGYTGGKKSQGVAYRSMGDHTEACQVDFDPRVISYRQLVDKFWTMHNPFRGKSSRQYRNAIWYHDEKQKKVIMESMAAISGATATGMQRIVQTAVEKKGPFYMAEEYHQQYNAKARGQYRGKTR